MSLSRTHPENRPPFPSERRRHARIALDCPVTISLADGEHAARLRDISTAGLCFFLDRRIPEMTVLGLELRLPALGGVAARTIAGRGVVVRCAPVSPHVDHYEVAVFLNDVDDENRERLDEYVGSRTERP